MTKSQWLAIKNKDKNSDGAFYYAVKRSKILHRPSCPARTCRPEDVIIFNSLEEAAEKGYRLCNRCKPDQPEWEGTKKELVKSAKKYTEEHYTENFSLKTIAKALFVNDCYLLRTFKEITGTTLLNYHNYIRCRAAKELLTRQELSISYISQSVGYCTQSHFARVFKKMFGRTPSEYRKSYLNSLDN